MALSIPLPVRPAPLYGNWTPALFRPRNRSIGGIVAEVTIEESATDDVQITEHPVEQGSPIADHAFKRPPSINIRAGWSTAGSYDLSAESGVYGMLLGWQAALLPFDVITGKRSYANMLIERLAVTTDEHSEFNLMATITCKQVFIVKTQTTDVQSTSGNPNDHKEPSKTGGETKKGETGPDDFGGDSTDYGKGVTKENIDPDDQAYTDPPPPEPQANSIANTATKNTSEQANIEKNIEMNRPEREVGQGTKDILKDRDQMMAQRASLMDFSSSYGPTRMIGGSATPIPVGY